MSKPRVNQATSERCLLTDITPYETPTLFSNWGSYHYSHTLHKKKPPKLLKQLFAPRPISVPFKFRIRKDDASGRTLSLIHPHHSNSIITFYRTYDLAMIRACQKSLISLRSPHHIARFYTYGDVPAKKQRHAEVMTEQTAYTSSYFAYNRYSHLHKFYDSAEFNELEKQFVHLSYFDVARLFPSLYTHSISWAIRGKHRTKRQVFQTRSCEKAFDSQFDRLLQQMNYKESHGIPIGPELCRIFAEIILQRVDGEIVARLATNGKVLGKDYRCYRFIDDYFLFHHDVEVRSIFRRALSEELERFGLYLNEAKESMRARPFISAVSAAKLEVSAMLSGLYVRRAMLRASRAYDEVSQLRALTKRSGVSFAEVSGFFMASLDRQVGMALRDVTENLFDILYVQLDLGFHVFRMDTRVATVYKMTAIVLRILKNRDRLRSPDLAKILDKIVFEMNGALQTTLAQGYPLESINILIALAAVSDHYSLAGAELIAMVDQLRRMRDDEYEAPSRLSYWEIVGLLYYCADGVEYGAVRSLLVDEAEKVIRHLDPFEYAESAHLILDLVACPYLDQADKDRLVHRFAAHHTAKPVTADIGHFINFVSSHSWYFNWARGENFWAHLRKKNFKVGY